MGCETKACDAADADASKDCNGHGKCDGKTGLCGCDDGWFSAWCTDGECSACTMRNCIDQCQNHGVCNNIQGQCNCDPNSPEPTNGALCKYAGRMEPYIADWSRSLDKWGWSTCEAGNLVYGLARDGAGDAIYNLAYAACAKPSEQGSIIALKHCYHENWWKSFDFAGGKFCRKNYFVAGLFRSHCNSLYCIEMAKCCQVERSLWSDCQWKQISKGGWGGPPKWPDTAPKKAGTYTLSEIMETQSAMATPGMFIAGFYRSEDHTLDGLTH